MSGNRLGDGPGDGPEDGRYEQETPGSRAGGLVEALRITETDNIPCDTPPPFRVELARLINRFSRENGSNTPDFVLAQYLDDCLAAWDRASRAREQWYAVELRIGGPRYLPLTTRSSKPSGK